MIPWAKPALFGDEKEFLTDALDSTWLSGGKYVDELEDRFAKLIGSRHAIAVSSGTAALHLALLAADVGAGDEVIVPGFTFVAPGNMVLATGARPIFVDVDADTWCLDLDEVRAHVSDRTKAILPVHVYGNTPQMDALRALADERGLTLIEDVAEAAFTKYDGKSAGSIGHFGCFSLQAAKTITTGEGGIVTTDSDEQAARIRTIRSHGMSGGRRYWHDELGYNYRLTNLQCALGCAQLNHLETIIQAKETVYQRYRQNLSDCPGITFQQITDKVDPVIWAVALKLDLVHFEGDRDGVMAALKERGIETRPGFFPFSAMPMYDCPPLPRAEDISARIISPPSFPTLTTEQVDHICAELESLIIS